MLMEGEKGNAQAQQKVPKKVDGIKKLVVFWWSKYAGLSVFRSKKSVWER